MSKPQRDRWVAVYNKTYSTLLKDGVEVEKADAGASRVANNSLRSEAAEDKPGRTYLSRLRDFVKDRVKDGKMMSDEDLTALARLARSSAGGLSTAAKRREASQASELLDICTSAPCLCGEADCIEHLDGDDHLFMEFKFADPPARINVLPKPGRYTHPAYGDVIITSERNANFVKNFNDGIYQTKVPIDIEHETKLSGAAGWMTELSQNEDGSVDAFVEWTDRGEEAIRTDRFKYFSPEWFNQWMEPMSKKVYKDILIGGAICTRPFFKEKALMPLVATEGGSLFIFDESFEDEELGEINVFAELQFEEIRMVPSQIGPYLEACIHSNFTRAADDLRKYSYVSQEERIALSNAIGEALKRFGEVASPTVLAKEIKLPAPYLYSQPDVGDVHVDSMAVCKMCGQKHKEGEACPPGGKKMATIEELQAQITDLTAKLTEQGNQVATLISEKTEAKTAADAASAELQKATETISTLQSESRTRRFTDMVMGNGGATDGLRWYGPVESNVKMLDELATAFGEDSDTFKNYVTQQQTTAKQLKESGLFKEVGANGAAAGETSGDAFKDAVTNYMKEHAGVSEADASAAVLAANPTFYNEAVKAQNKAIARRGSDAD